MVVPRALQLYTCGGMYMGILGVWFGMFIDWAVRSLLFAVRYLSGRWQMKKVI